MWLPVWQRKTNPARSSFLNDPIGGRPKIETARQVLLGLIQQLPGKADVALRVYGHRRPRDCADIELVVPLQPKNAALLAEQIRGLQARGAAPLGAALRQAPGRLRRARAGA